MDLCPILKEECKREDCAWWGGSSCRVADIGDNLDKVADQLNAIYADMPTR